MASVVIVAVLVYVVEGGHARPALWEADPAVGNGFEGWVFLRLVMLNLGGRSRSAEPGDTPDGGSPDYTCGDFGQGWD